ncbi:MAG: type II toxin-antitoxin system RelB family antitoxin [Burkholderiales bacterium]
MLALRIEKELERKIAALARITRRSKSEVVREAILRLVEDTEDLELAERALKGTRSAKPLRRLRKELGLDR